MYPYFFFYKTVSILFHKFRHDEISGGLRYSFMQIPKLKGSHQLQIGSALKTVGRKCQVQYPIAINIRSNSSEFFVVFFETCINTRQDPLERPPTVGNPPIVLGPSCDNRT